MSLCRHSRMGEAGWKFDDGLAVAVLGCLFHGEVCVDDNGGEEIGTCLYTCSTMVRGIESSAMDHM